MKIIYLNTKIDKIIFLTPMYPHNGVLITQYYVKNVYSIFTTCRNPFCEICLCNDYLSASKIHEKYLSFNEQYLLQTLG